MDGYGCRSLLWGQTFDSFQMKILLKRTIFPSLERICSWYNICLCRFSPLYADFTQTWLLMALLSIVFSSLLTAWFEITDDHNRNVYVSNLPLDTAPEELLEIMSKCGIIMTDPRTNLPKIKMYKDAEGKLKGDALCTYMKVHWFMTK